MPDSYTIRLSAADVQTLGKWLGQGRYNEVAPLMVSIQRQLDEQNAATAAPPDPPVSTEQGGE